MYGRTQGLLTHLVIIPLDIWNVHVMSRWANIFVFFTSEDINTNQVDLQEKKTSVTVGPREARCHCHRHCCFHELSKRSL